MTIKDFARLCSTSDKTLRYYDRIGLLTPARVDERSGYRHYDEAQSLDFVKIKTLQSAGFTISEIKTLLKTSSAAIVRELDRLIAEQKEKLEQIEIIKRSYLDEMNQMEKTIAHMREIVAQAMQGYDPTDEFGIDRTHYERLMRGVLDFFEAMATDGGADDLTFSEYPNGDAAGDSVEEHSLPSLLDDENYEIVFERHGFARVRDFFDELAIADDGHEYCMAFRLIPGKAEHTAFVNVALGLLLEKTPKGKPRSIGCHVGHSDDGSNHFYLFRHK